MFTGSSPGFAKLKEWVPRDISMTEVISLDPGQSLPLLFQDKAAMTFQGHGSKIRTSSPSPEDPK